MGSSECKAVQDDPDEGRVQSHGPDQFPLSERQKLTDQLRTQKALVLDLEEKLSRNNKVLTEERKWSEALLAKVNSQIKILNDAKATHLRIDQLVLDNQKMCREKQQLILKNDELISKNDDLVLEIKRHSFSTQGLSSENVELAQEKRDMAMMMQKVIRVSRDHEMVNDELAVDIKNLTQQNHEMTVKIEDLNLQSEALSFLNENLNVQNQNLSLQNQNLTIRTKNLSAHNEDLGAENKDMSLQIEYLRVENQTLGAQNQTLGFENEELTRIQDGHQDEVEILERICLRLKRKNLGIFGRRMRGPELELERMKHKMRDSCNPLPSHLSTVFSRAPQT